MGQKEAILKIAEAFQQDVGYGRARIDHQTRMNLDLSIGDVIEIEGNKKTSVVVWRAHPTDEGKGIIRVDNLTRKNAGTGLGERVKIRKAEVKEAKDVTLAPLISKGQQVQFGSGIDNLIKKGLLKRPITKGDSVIIPGIALFGSSLPFLIINTNPGGIVSINEVTKINVKEEAAQATEEEGPKVSYEDIGGLHDEISKVREMIELPLKHPEVFNRLGIDPPKGVLLHGPPGTGKTLIAKAVANESGASFYTINGPEVMSKFYGQSEENLRKIFEEAEKNAPSIIFIDEIDAIAPKRSEVHGEVERRVVSQMLTLMDGLKGRGKLIVIGATNLPDTLDPALRRPGRFDREIRIDAPDRKGRKEILQIHTRGMPKTPPFNKVIALEELKDWMKDIEIPRLLKQIRDKKIEEEEYKNNLKTFEKNNASLIKEKQEVEQELIQCRKKFEFRDSSKLEKILESLTLKKAGVAKQLNELNAKIDELNEKIGKNKNKIYELENKINDKKALEELFELEKRISVSDEVIQSIIEGQKEVEHRMKIIGIDDPRYELMKNSQSELEKLLENIKDLQIKKRLKDGLATEEVKQSIKKRSLDTMLNEIADGTYGYVGADLAALAREAAMSALRRYLPEIDLEKPIPVEVLEKMEVNMEDFKNAHRGIEPSAMREFLIEIPKVNWDDVGGLKVAKQQLQEAVEWPLTKPEVFKRMGIAPPRGILLYGAPGTGKTLLAKAVANESKANFISIKGPEVMSKWVGESEKAVRELFKKARQVAPTIVFLDELDSIAPMRGTDAGSRVTDSVVNQLLTSIDGLESMEGVVVIGATNRPDIIDPSLLRPGRFDRLVLVPAPDFDSRVEILKIHTKQIPIEIGKKEIEEMEKELKNYFSLKNGVDLREYMLSEKAKKKVSAYQKTGIMEVEIHDNDSDKKNKESTQKKVNLKNISNKELFIYYLAYKTEAYSGADAEALCREAAMMSIREDEKATKVKKVHFDKAMEDVRASITPNIINFYEKVSENLGSGIAKKDKSEKDIQYT
jgi:CDC48 subfamily AAA family ATPase